MFEIFFGGRRVMVSPVECGGYTAEVLEDMARAGYVFRLNGKLWKPGNAGAGGKHGNAEYEQGSLLK